MIKENYNEIIEYINLARAEMASELHWFNTIDQDTKKLLEQDGFTVKITCDQRDGDTTKITW